MKHTRSIHDHAVERASTNDLTPLSVALERNESRSAAARDKDPRENSQHGNPSSQSQPVPGREEWDRLVQLSGFSRKRWDLSGLLAQDESTRKAKANLDYLGRLVGIIGVG